MSLDSVKGLKEYELIKDRWSDDLNSQGMLLRHKKSGARVFLLSNDDENKVFYIGFRTPPVDSTGLTHILEHSVLCGSKKYPLKDPFVELVKGSLNTFLNAMTYPDKTVYPVASCNDKDFKNLMNVYLDAVFYPNIYKEEKIFRQEGWHYDLRSKEDELTINGVVYNEMKGAFSSPDSTLERVIFNSLFPDTAYGFESGGDPDFIPDLSYERFLDFHRSYYHPSNSFIYLYGDMDMAERLTMLDREYLKDFDEKEIDSKIKYQKPFEKKMYHTFKYGIANDETLENNTYLSYNFVVENNLDKKNYIAFQILDGVLLDSPGAPLRQALIDAGIGTDISSSYDNGILQPYFSIVAKNANSKDLESFERIIKDTLEDIVKKGINKKALRAVINSLEFQYREADFGSYPKGLFYGLDALDSWLYDENDPFMHLEENETYAFMREKVDSSYFEDLVSKYFLNNPFSSVVVMEPEKGLNAKKDEKLKEKLKEYKKALSDTELEKIIEDTKALEAYQEEEESKEAMESIPLLELSDIKKEAREFDYEEEKLDEVTLLTHKIFTNGIGYLYLGFDIKDLGDEDLKYAGLLKNLLNMVNTENFTYNELFNEINEKSGGIKTSITSYINAKDSNRIRSFFSFEAKVFEDRLDFAFDIIKEIIKTSKIDDEKRLKEIIGMLKSRIQSSLLSSGHTASAKRALASVSKGGRLSDYLSGFEFYRFIERIDKNFEKEKKELIEGLKRSINIIFRKENLFVDYIVTDPAKSDLKKLTRDFMKDLYQKPYEKKEKVLKLNDKNEGFKSSAKIQYVAAAGNFRDAGFDYTGALRVMKVMLGYDYLWTNVRVKGGAYGCMSSFSKSGDSFFVSYRDPNLKNTLDIYKKAADYLESFDPDDRDMLKYIIGAISAMDLPLTPSMKGVRAMSLYLSEESYEGLQKERDQVLSCNKEDIRALAPYVRAIVDSDHICVIGGEETIEENKELFDKVENLIAFEEGNEE
ncbi:MAG: insulinase family protein [Lachnospiraceae bacterium]|nr:insulinase family protein [Lachnospiraceae bacterium]